MAPASTRQLDELAPASTGLLDELAPASAGQLDELVPASGLPDLELGHALASSRLREHAASVGRSTFLHSQSSASQSLDSLPHQLVL